MKNIKNAKIKFYADCKQVLMKTTLEDSLLVHLRLGTKGHKSRYNDFPQLVLATQDPNIIEGKELRSSKAENLSDNC